MFDVLSVLPCVLGFVCGWVIWDRWLAQTATILVWGLFLLPGTAIALMRGGSSRSMRFWLPFLGLVVVSLLLTELGLRLRDRYQGYLRRRFANRFGHPS
jgi:hypothetical protein